LAKKVLQTSYAYPEINGVEERLQLLNSLKSIQIMRDPNKGTLQKIQIDYYDFDDDKKLIINRKVEIDILETIITGDPIKIRMMIQSPWDPASKEEQIILQDCNYIINEATSGKLFDLRRERPFDVHIEEISEKGEILKVVFYGYVKENNIKKYTTKESRALSPLELGDSIKNQPQ
jgi:hypothetical protein